MRDNRITIILLAIIAIVLLGFGLRCTREIFLPLVIAWLLSYILGPVVTFMVKRGVPVGIAVLAVLLVVLGGCFLGGVFLNGRMTEFVNAYPKYQARMESLIDTVTVNFGWLNNMLDSIDWGARVGKFLMNLSTSFLVFVSQLVLVILFLVFMLLEKPFYDYKIKKAFSLRQGEKVTRVVNSISGQIGSYLFLQLVISLVTGFLVWLVLTIIGVDFAVTWGALTFLFNFIPNIGPIIVSIPPILIALAQYYPNLWPAVITLVCLLSIHMIIGNGIAPKVMGDRLDLSPVVILISLLFWGWVWGVVGAIISVPIASAIKITCENIKPLKPVSVMLGSGKGCRDRGIIRF